MRIRNLIIGIIILSFPLVLSTQPQDMKERVLLLENEKKHLEEKIENQQKQTHELKNDLKNEIYEAKTNMKELLDEKEDKVYNVIILISAAITIIIGILTFIGWKRVRKIVDDWIMKKAQKEFTEKLSKYQKDLQHKGEDIVDAFKKKIIDYENDLDDYKKKYLAMPEKPPNPPEKLTPVLKKQIEEFVNSLDKAKEINNFTAIDWFYKGYNSENDDEKIGYYTRAIELDTMFVGAYNNRGTSYSNKKEFDLAIKDYTKAIELDPNNASAYCNRGIVYENKKDYYLAVEDYVKAIELNPNKTGYRLNLIELYIVQANYQESINLLNKNQVSFISLEDITISKYLECVALKALGKDITKSDDEFNNILKVDFKIVWNTLQIEEWLKEVDLSKETKDYINELTNMLKKKM